VLQRVSFLSDSFEYDPSDPDSYRSGVIHVTKAQRPFFIRLVA